MNYKSVFWTCIAQGHPARLTVGKLDQPLADLSLAQFFHSLFSLLELAGDGLIQAWLGLCHRCIRVPLCIRLSGHPQLSAETLQVEDT